MTKLLGGCPTTGTTFPPTEEMTAGRGTHGRSWHSPKGGLYLSFVLRGIPDAHLLTLALGNAVADALEVAGVDYPEREDRFRRQAATPRA